MVRINLRLPVESEAAAAARHCMESLGRLMSPPALEDVKLLVSELVTNSVRHAGLHPDDYVEVEVVADDGHIWVDVRDRGTGFHPIPPAATDHGAGGWGLYLVDRIAQRWGVEHDDNGTDVWFELALPQTRSERGVDR